MAPFLGFFEVMILLLAATKVFQNLDNWLCYFTFGIGFALGSYKGMRIVEKIALGVQLIRIITSKDTSRHITVLREKGYEAIATKAEGSKGKVGVIFSVVNRKKIKFSCKIDCQSIFDFVT
jgi:uncharacterized protein YebE (UPF0316 family)